MARDLRLLAGAVFLSAAGDLLALVVLALHVHELTGSGPAVSALVATTLVPMVVVAPLAGLVTDRFESVRVLVAASLAQAALAAALAFGPSDLTAILVLASLLTVGNAFAQPAEFTLVPAVAGTHRLTEATGVIEAARYAGFAAGPVLAAGLAALGSRPALLVNAVTFLAVAAAAGALRARRPPRPAAPGRPRALDGVRLLRRDPVLRVTLGAALGALVFISTALTVELFYVKDVVGASDTAYALVVCGWMAGMVLGATAVARRIPARAAAAAALVALAVQGAGMAGQAAWAVLPVALAGYLVGGLGHGAKNVFLRSVIAVRTPEAVHGRAFAAYNAARSTAELGALAAGGVLVGLLGPRAALVLAGLGPIAASAAGLTALRRRGRAAPRRDAAGRAVVPAGP
jgi:Na+/melibiose symporter-like transporter